MKEFSSQPARISAAPKCHLPTLWDQGIAERQARDQRVSLAAVSRSNVRHRTGRLRCRGRRRSASYEAAAGLGAGGGWLRLASWVLRAGSEPARLNVSSGPRAASTEA